MEALCHLTKTPQKQRFHVDGACISAVERFVQRSGRKLSHPTIWKCAFETLGKNNKIETVDLKTQPVSLKKKTQFVCVDATTKIIIPTWLTEQQSLVVSTHVTWVFSAQQCFPNSCGGCHMRLLLLFPTTELVAQFSPENVSKCVGCFYVVPSPVFLCMVVSMSASLCWCKGLEESCGVVSSLEKLTSSYLTMHSHKKYLSTGVCQKKIPSQMWDGLKDSFMTTLSILTDASRLQWEKRSWLYIREVKSKSVFQTHVTPFKKFSLDKKLENFAMRRQEDWPHSRSQGNVRNSETLSLTVLPAPSGSRPQRVNNDPIQHHWPRHY